MHTILTDRLKLEQTILGSCLLENGYVQVADILTARNFSTPEVSNGQLMDHQLIFRVFEKFYPVKPIDITTVAHELSHTPGFASYIAELTSRVSSSANLRYYAVVLLEYNLRNSFIELLQKGSSSCHVNISTIAVLQEITDEALDRDNDIFEVIEKSIIHLKNVHVEDFLIQSLEEFSSKMDKRIQNINKLASIDCLLNNLSNLNGLANDTISRMAISHLTDVLKAIIATGKIKAEFADKIFQLNYHA